MHYHNAFLSESYQHLHIETYKKQKHRLKTVINTEYQVSLT